MNIGYRTRGFVDEGWHRALEVLETIGYQSVEICLEDTDVLAGESGAEEELGDALERSGLEVASISYHGDADELDAKIENTYRAIELAGRLRAPTVVFNTERAETGRKREQLAGVISRCIDFCAAAGEADILLACEPEPGLVIDDTRDMLEVMGAVDASRLGVNLDIGHAWITDPDLLASIRTLGDRIYHTHIEDIAGREHKHLMPGRGDIDLGAVLSTFEAIGYDGHLVLDLYADLYAGLDPREQARDALDCIRGIIGEV